MATTETDIIERENDVYNAFLKQIKYFTGGQGQTEKLEALTKAMQVVMVRKKLRLESNRIKQVNRGLLPR